MRVDDGRLHELIVESEDLQLDALRDTQGSLDGLAELREERRRDGIDPEAVERFNSNRRSVLRNGGLGMGALAARGLFAGSIGAALAGIVSSPASAQDGGVDVQILQTASSLENLAVATYGAALGLDFIKNGNPVVVTFAQTTMRQHMEHGNAFKAMTDQLGGEKQEEPNPKYAKVVQDATPGLTDATKVVELASSLEEVATQTYNANMALLEDKESKALMASVMGVESQHLAVLRAVGALLAGGEAGAALIKIPTEPAKLPKAAGSVSFPEPFEGIEMASPPEEGAVK